MSNKLNIWKKNLSINNKSTHLQILSNNMCWSVKNRKYHSSCHTSVSCLKARSWFSFQPFLKLNFWTTYWTILFTGIAMELWLRKKSKNVEFIKFMEIWIRSLEQTLTSTSENKRYNFVIILVRNHDKYISRFKRSGFPWFEPHYPVRYSPNYHRLW